jgi:5-methylcytosine-specific restriction endonuclease McrA
MKPDKAGPEEKKFIVYIGEFDKYDENKEPICRNHNCRNKICKPFRKYCSKKCNKEFTKWYDSNFYWRKVRNSVLRRDNFTCQECGIRLRNKKKRFGKISQNWLECDHLIPKSSYYDFGYRFDSLENKVKTTMEFFHNKDNLRTLCYMCHKEITMAHRKQKWSTNTKE